MSSSPRKRSAGAPRFRGGPGKRAAVLAVLGSVLLAGCSTGADAVDVNNGGEFRFVAGTRPIRALLLLLGLVSMTGMPYAVLMPVMAQDVLHSGASGLGLLMGAAGTGALTGALALAWHNSLRGLGRWVGFGAVAFGTSLILFSLSQAFWLSSVTTAWSSLDRPLKADRLITTGETSTMCPVFMYILACS